MSADEGSGVKLGGVLRAIAGLALAAALAAGQENPRSATEAPAVPRFTREGVRVHLLAPGMIVELYGEHLGPAPLCAEIIPRNVPYRTEACGVRVMVAASPAGLLYVGEKQINLKIPADAPEEGTAPIRVCVRDRCSDPVTFRFSAHKSYIAIQGVAYVHMPVWIEAEQPAGCGIDYPYSVWPWYFGGYEFEVRRDGKPLTPVWPQLRGGIVGTWGGTVAPHDSPRSRLPLHLVYHFEEPGTYAVRLTDWNPGPRGTIGGVVRCQSDWTNIEVKSADETRREAWLRAEAARVAGATPGELVGDIIPSLLAWPDEKALAILLPLREHPDGLVSQFASQSLAGFDPGLLFLALPPGQPAIRIRR